MRQYTCNLISRLFERVKNLIIKIHGLIQLLIKEFFIIAVIQENLVKSLVKW